MAAMILQRGLEGAVAPYGAEFAVLEHPQQMGLKRQGKVADLVKKKRSFLGGLEEAHLVADGAREGALLVAEKLRLDQGLDVARAVGRDKGVARLCAERMERPGHHFFARSRLSGDRDHLVVRGDAFDKGDDVEYLGVSADHPREGVLLVELLFQQGHLASLREHRVHVVRRWPKPFGVDGPGQKGEGAVLDGLDPVPVRASDEHDLGPRVGRLYIGQQVRRRPPRE